MPAWPPMPSYSRWTLGLRRELDSRPSPRAARLSLDAVRRYPIHFTVAVSIVTFLFWLGLASWTSQQRGHLAISQTDVLSDEVVATIADLRDPRWSPEAVVRRSGEKLYVHETLAMESGLAEIHFDSGTIAIVEGPAEIQVTSGTTVRLTQGKMVANVADPDLGFVVHSPAAVFEDLGTEFGVDVAPRGGALLHVFAGEVRASPVAKAADGWAARVVRGGESLQVDQQGPRTPENNQFAKTNFMRAIPAADVVLDLADIVAGGNGQGRSTDAGVDLMSGAPVRSFHQAMRPASGRFVDVTHSPWIDGVFVVATAGTVDRIDSGGGRFAFPSVTGGAWGSVWAFVQRQPGAPNSWIHPLPDAAGRFVAMHSNAGMTIDLASLRTAHPGFAPKRFFSYGNNQFFESRGGRGNQVDLWVLVDGEVRYVQKNLPSGDKPIRIDVALAPTDRFLTLAATDGGDGLACDFLLWRHPQVVLEAALSKAEEKLPP